MDGLLRQAVAGDVAGMQRVRRAVRENRLGYQEAGRFLKFYEDGLNGYTYLEEPGD